jgi:hypothetical protein
MAGRSLDDLWVIARRVGCAFGALGLSACAPSSPASIHTVDYYRAHSTERTAELARCGNDPGELASTASCVNAREAARIEGTGSLRTLPPMGLPTAPPNRARTP